MVSLSISIYRLSDDDKDSANIVALTNFRFRQELDSVSFNLPVISQILEIRLSVKKGRICSFLFCIVKEV